MNGPAGTNDAGPRYDVEAYAINYNHAVFTNVPELGLADYSGTNVATSQILKAASAVLAEFRGAGYSSANVAISMAQITNGVVTMNVYNGVFPQVLLSGKSYSAEALTETAGATNGPPETNAEPHIPVVGYEVLGNDLLSDETLQSIFSKYVGTNVSFGDISNAVKELQLEYRDRGFETVSVSIPTQRGITNYIIKFQVTEGRLAAIKVTGNRFYSSNNVMRTLPSLKTNMILNNTIFQDELNRANSNPDRQIYPILTTNGVPVGTTGLILDVHDHLPLHGKIELNNQSSPGTPEMRLNSSAVYNNLWQENHALGIQYSYSPGIYKQGDQWPWYDQPLVANYSGFYRMPLGNPRSVADAVESNPDAFGYSEATRKFELPPPSGTPELNFFASRSTIDTGIQTGTPVLLFNSVSRNIQQATVTESLTVNQDIGFRFSQPLRQFAGISSALQAGLDFKTYNLANFETNNFIITQTNLDHLNNPLPPIVSVTHSTVPASISKIRYLPLSLRWDASWPETNGSLTTFGLGYTPNLWHSDTRSNLDNISGSTRSTGFWHVLNGYLGRDQALYHGWHLALRADAQWASEPLISNEQYGNGGIAGVRGYREGEVFGDRGWKLTSELKTPVHTVGMINRSERLTVRSSLFMDYGETYLLDPNGRDGSARLWGAGAGLAANFGSHTEARLILAMPLLRSPTTEADQLRIYFGLNAQF